MQYFPDMTVFDAAGLADIHNHLVPGVDDGARGLEEALRHLADLSADGVTRLAVSPHLDGRLVHEDGALEARMHRLATAFRELRAAAAARAPLPTLVFGQEILVPVPDTARRLFQHPGLGIAGTSYALIEFGFDLGEDPPGVVRAVIDAGRKPIVAHPERYRRNGGQVGLEEIRSWKDSGALLQVNAGSVLGDYGPEIQARAFSLIDDGLADLIATDHHADSRAVSPARTRHALEERGAAEQATLLLATNPRRVLDDQATLPVPPLRR